GALAALAARRGSFPVAGVPAWSLVAALVLFSFGALLAVLAIVPFRYSAADVAALGVLVERDVFRGPSARVDRRLVELRLAELRSARHGNAFKGSMVVAAFVFIVAALVAL